MLTFFRLSPGIFCTCSVWLATYFLININWVFFRADSFRKAWLILNGMFEMNAKAGLILPTMHVTMVMLIVGGIVFRIGRCDNKNLSLFLRGFTAALVPIVEREFQTQENKQ